MEKHIQTIEGPLETTERRQTIASILEQFKLDGEFCPSVLEQIVAHRIEADELTEAGLAYEEVRAIEHYWNWAL